MNRTVQRLALTAAATAAIAGSTIAVSSPAEAIYVPCDKGYACLNHYTQQVTPSTGKDVDWYRYGTYNLSGQTGDVSWCNAQTGGAKFLLYSGYGGSGSLLWSIPNGQCVRHSSTPVNSVVLKP